MKTPKHYLQISLFLAASLLSARAGTFFSDFNTGALPTGTHTNAGGSGGAYLEAVDGVGNSGCLKITKTINSQNGSFILDDLDGGNPIYGFDINFNLRIGGSGNPADGFALVVAPDIGDTSLWGETGTGSGFRFTWGTYTGSGQTPPDPGIRVRVGPGGNIVAYKGYTVAGMSTGGTDPSTWWSNAHIRLNPDGSLTFDFKGANVFSNYFIPGYQDLVNAGVPVRFGIAGRTGGLNDNFWVDNLSITTFTNPMVGISQQPRSSKVLAGDDAIFDVRVANVNSVTYQWLSNGVPISGATSPTLIIPAITAGASGSGYSAVCTGPNNVVTSTVATLTVINLTLPTTPQLSYNFNDGLVPAGTAVFGTAFVDTSGGVGGSATVKLTQAANGQFGAFVISDPDAGAPVYGFTLRAKLLVGQGTTPPADGFAIAFGNDIPADPTATVPQFEEGQGLGSGLIVSFDIYNNGAYLGYPGTEAQPAPSIDVRFGGNVIATTQLPLSFMESVDRLDDAIVQLNNDGTINVVYRGSLIFDHLFVPGFTSISGGSFVIAGRTGGLNENIWVDNVELTTVTDSGAVRIVAQSGNQTVLVNHAVTNSITVNNPTGVTYQWYRGASQLSGATDSSYVLPTVALTDSGATFTAVATKASVSVTSAPVTLTVVNLTAPAAPQLSYNFDDGLVPSGTSVYGNSYVTIDGGVANSGCLHLTDAINGQVGAFVLTSPVLSGSQISAIAASWDVRLGGGSGTPADGYSFNWAPNLTQGTVGNAENGSFNTTGLSITFRIYLGAGNNDNPPSPYIGVRYKGNFVATTQIPYIQLDTGTDLRRVLLRVDSDGKLYLSYGERVLYNGLQLPNYTFIANSLFGIYGRTGGENDNQWFDNINIQATQSTGPMTIVQQPANATVLVGQTANFTVAVSAPVGATYQWQKNGVNISGATTTSYTTPATTLGDNGAAFRVTANGASGSATSSNAILTVVAPITITSPGLVYDFNDGLLPAGATLNGNAYVDGSGGGVTNSGVLHLTDALNGQGGTFVIPDFNSNAPVKALTVYFAMHANEGTAPPADGWSFIWCSSNDLPAGLVFGEDGTGNGLIVGFDVFDNGNETPPAPSIDLHYKGLFLATRQLPYQQIQSGPGFADTFIRVDANGFCDVQYNGMVIFNHVQLPNYTAMSGGEFAWGARTGGLNENQWVDNIEIATTLGLVPVPLSFTVSGGNLRLTWDTSAGFKLQSATSLSPQNWTDVPGATSPYLAPLTGPAQYFRLAPAN